MNAVYLALPFALALGFGFTAAFVWTAKKGQYDDLETPALRILIEDPVAVPAQHASEERQKR